MAALNGLESLGRDHSSPIIAAEANRPYLSSMASQPQHEAPDGSGPGSPQHFIPPSARERRAQAVHRLQIGFSGLAAMLLLVGLASAIMDRARQVDSAAPSPVVGVPVATSSANSDPLADIGVIPSPDAAPAKAGAEAAPQVIPPAVPVIPTEAP